MRDAIGIRAVLEPTDDAALSVGEREVLGRCRGKLLYFHLGGPMRFGAAT